MKRIIGGKEYNIVNEEEIRKNPDGSVTINWPDGTSGIVTTSETIINTNDMWIDPNVYKQQMSKLNTKVKARMDFEVYG